MDEWHYRPAADRDLSAVERLSSVRREVGLVGWVTQAGWRLVTKAYLSFHHRLTVWGREHLPGSCPFVMVANHSSHLDALVMAAALPWSLRHYAFPIAAGDVFFETPGISLFSAMMLNALPMWRRRCGAHAMQELRDRLASEPAILIVFPEGTRSRDGTMAQLKPGIGMLVAESDVPVVPCHIAGTFEACPPGRVLPRRRRITARIGERLDFRETKNNREGWRVVAAQAEEAVRRLAPGPGH